MNLDMEVNKYGVRDLMATAHEISFLTTMVYIAHHPTRIPVPDARRASYLPYVSAWVDNWGRRGDIALVAEQEHELLGAACCRLFSSRDEVAGFLGEDAPILLLAVLPQYRRRGIGRCLLTTLMQRAKDAAFSTLSLAVAAPNPCYALYEQAGFHPLRISDSSLITMWTALSYSHSDSIPSLTASDGNGNVHAPPLDSERQP
ncbi:MAG: hypothetical protein NVS2B12_08630 [Ktedonobacteraceae bacterium]